MKKGVVNKNLILVALIIFIIIVAIIITIFFLRFDALTNNLNKGLPVNILFCFTEDEKLQFMELLIYSPVTKKAGIYFLPAELGSKLSSLDRVDALGILYKKHDLKPLMEEIKVLTGVEFEFQITFSMDKFAKLIDQIEGVELFISNPVDMEYNNRKILIPSGNVILDGDKAVDYLLYEDETEEQRESVWRKQKVLQAVIKRWGDGTINNELLNPVGFNYLSRTMDTNITSRDLRSLIDEIRGFDPEHIIFQRVEGKISRIDDKDLLIPFFEGDLIKHSIKQIIDTLDSDEVFNEDALTITLEILNGTLKNGLASQTASLFKQLGYEVANIANADHHEYEKTIVMDRVGRIGLAEEVAGIIQCTNVYTQMEEDLESIFQVTIILGKDFDGRYCKK